jgi:HEAT repeat protein
VRLFGPPDVDRMLARGDVKRLIKALRDSREGEHAAAAAGLAELGEPAAMPPIGMVQDPHSSAEVRVRAAQVLGAIGDPQAAGALLGMLRTGGPARDAALDALVQIGGPAVGRLTQAFGHATPDGRAQIGRELAAIGGPAVTSVEQLLRHQRPEVRHAAIGVLGVIEDPQAVEALLRARRDVDAAVRVAAVEELHRRGPVALRRLMAVLTTDLTDRDREVRRRADETLGRMNPDDAAAERLVHALRDDAPEVAAARASRHLAHPRVQAELERALQRVRKRLGPLAIRLHAARQRAGPPVDPFEDVQAYMDDDSPGHTAYRLERDARLERHRDELTIAAEMRPLEDVVTVLLEELQERRETSSAQTQHLQPGSAGSDPS